MREHSNRPLLHICFATGASYVCRVPIAPTHLNTRLDSICIKYDIYMFAWICACAETSPLFAHTPASEHLFRTAAPRPGWPQATSQSLRVGGRVNTQQHPTHTRRLSSAASNAHAISVRHNLDRYAKCTRAIEKHSPTPPPGICRFKCPRPRPHTGAPERGPSE